MTTNKGTKSSYSTGENSMADVVDDIFKAFDKNKDGFLDKKETRCFFKATLSYGDNFSEEAF